MDLQAKRRKLNTSCAVQEFDVGITEFVNTENPGFTGLIKQRFSDFQVNEIDVDGHVVVLKNLDPSLSGTTATAAVEADPQDEATRDSDELAGSGLTPEANESLLELSSVISRDLVQQCCDLLNNPKLFKKIYTEPISDKEARTKVHALVRTGFASKLESSTENARLVLNKVHKRSRKRKLPSAATGSGDFLHFTLYKENKETMEAISVVARFLHIPPKAIQFAGTKDRRAATTQRVSWRRGDAERIRTLNSKLNPSIRVGDLEYKHAGLRLGDLKGNQFGIVVRGIDKESLPVIEQALDSLKTRGFVNYFGMQRFGTFSTPSHHVGRFILCQDYEGAVNCLLSPQDITSDDSRDARKVWAEEHDATKALELMPKRCIAEHSLLEALSESGSMINALLRVPHTLRTMYAHAYQSYVWNAVASERVKMGSSLLVGDLVLVQNDESAIQRAYVVTAEDVAEAKYTIFDVVLPTPGFDITYPEHLVAHYERVMSKDGIDCHNMKRSIKEFSLFGAYRGVFAKPMHVDWELRRYAQDEDTVMYTDREAIEQGTKLAPEPDSTPKSDAQSVETIPGPKLAIVIRMGLGTSQYATMALREAMKQETSRHGGIYFSDKGNQSVNSVDHGSLRSKL